LAHRETTWRGGRKRHGECEEKQQRSYRAVAQHRGNLPKCDALMGESPGASLLKI
jgi:hypothetical protein